MLQPVAVGTSGADAPRRVGATRSAPTRDGQPRRCEGSRIVNETPSARGASASLCNGPKADVGRFVALTIQVV